MEIEQIDFEVVLQKIIISNFIYILSFYSSQNFIKKQENINIRTMYENTESGSIREVYLCIFFLNRITSFDFLILQYNIIIMEEQKKKFLLSRIKKQQQLIISEYDNLKRQFLGKILLKQKNDHFLEQATHLMELNTTLASNLFEYLDKTQMQAVFERINTVYYDLVDKFKKVYREWYMLENGKDVKQIREMCDICNEKIQINRIQNIKKSIQNQSECRTVLIRRLIEESEMERVKPIFSEQQDRSFKAELQKVFQNKQMVLQTNINETNVFLTKVETDITDFMISFRNEFANWGGEKEQESENLNWGKTIKGFIDKKLSTSFRQKIPDWIKKLHNMFNDSQPVQPKIYTVSKEIQTADYFSQKQISLKKELDEATNKLIIKRQALSSLEKELQNEKRMSKTLKEQKEMLQKLYQDQMQQLSKLNLINQTKCDPGSQVPVKECIDEMQNNQKEGKITKKKIAIIPVKHQKIKSNLSQQYNLEQQQQNQLNHSHSILQENISEIKQPLNQDNASEHKQGSFNAISSIIMDGYRGKGQVPKLKKKIYNRQKKQEPNTSKIDKIQRSLENKNEIHNNVSMRKLKQEIKSINSEVKHDLKATKMPLISSSGQKLNNSISVAKDISNIYKKRDSLHNNKMIPKALQLNKIAISRNVLPNSANVLIKGADQTSNEIQVKEPELQNDSRNAVKNYKQVFQLLHSMSQYTGLSKQKQGHLIKVIQTFFDEVFVENNQPSKQISVHKQEKRLQKLIKRYNTEENSPSPIIKNNFKNNSEYFQNNQNKKIYKRTNQIQEKTIKLPKISDHLAQSQMKVDEPQPQLTADNMILFIDDKIALKYEESFMVMQNDKHSQKPTPRQLQKIQSIYSVLQSIKAKNNHLYRQICSFIRYPNTAMKNRSMVIDIIKELPFSSFCNYFMKIQWFHRQCEINSQQLFCKHIECFFSNIMKMKDNNERKVKKSQMKTIQATQR